MSFMFEYEAQNGSVRTTLKILNHTENQNHTENFDRRQKSLLDKKFDQFLLLLLARKILNTNNFILHVKLTQFVKLYQVF